MFTIIKLLKSFLKIFNSLAAPWQVFVGALLGTLLGFLPVIPLGKGVAPVAPLGLCILALAIVINCHLGSVILFFGLGWLLAKLLVAPAVMIGEQFSGLAKTSSEIPFLYASGWSHTGWLGLTILGAVIAPILGLAMYKFTIVFRTKLRERLLASKKARIAGKVGGNMILVRITCWFFDI